jgi:hypothetical protein
MLFLTHTSRKKPTTRISISTTSFGWPLAAGTSPVVTSTGRVPGLHMTSSPRTSRVLGAHDTMTCTGHVHGAHATTTSHVSPITCICFSVYEFIRCQYTCSIKYIHTCIKTHEAPNTYTHKHYYTINQLTKLLHYILHCIGQD